MLVGLKPISVIYNNQCWKLVEGFSARDSMFLAFQQINPNKMVTIMDKLGNKQQVSLKLLEKC